MMTMPQAEPFTYWKRPQYQWIIVAAAILQLLCLWLNVQEYRDISVAGIFSQSEWEGYAAQKLFQCALNGLTAALFLGSFLIGILARTQKAARLGEGLLLLVSALIWGVLVFALPLTLQGITRIVWILILFLTLAGSAHAFWRRRNR